MVKKISYKNGITIELDDEIIFLDPIVSNGRSFVSHAHIDHSPYLNLKEPFTTKETEELIKVRDFSFKAYSIEQNKKIKFKNFSVKLIDSQHILGSSMILIETDEEKILYTGDFRKRCFDENVDILITEATYGLPEFIFPPPEEEIDKMIKWIKVQTLNKRVEIGAYALGKAQEIIKILNENGIIPAVSKTIENFNKIYRKFGEKLETDKKSEVVIRPLHEVISNPLPNYAHCVISGWGIIDRFPFKTFIISDHLDFKGLTEFVENINPEIIYTVHGYSKEFAEYLNKRGYTAYSLI